jgi:negative regulator of replication initiation
MEGRVMATIEVDFEVFKELTVRRESESMTENDVIRVLLGFDDQAAKPTAGSETKGGNPWVCKGVAFPLHIPAHHEHPFRTNVNTNSGLT